MGKSWITSRTIWAAIIGGLIEIVTIVMEVLQQFPEGTSLRVAAAIGAAAPVLMAIFRVITSEPIKEVWKG
jgi:hypothetical protein